jgi:putative endonuclease
MPRTQFQKKYHFFVYIMSNHERSAYYIGFCNNLVRRVIEHKYGFGSSFTKKYHLTDLLYYEIYQYVYDAIYREKELKKWRREKKLDLIKSLNPGFNDLSEEIFENYGVIKSEILKTVDELKEKYNKTFFSVISTRGRNL